MIPAYVMSTAAMGTVVSIEIVGDNKRRPPAAQSALEWFSKVESVCSRFDKNSEVRAVCRNPGRPVTLSPMLFEVLRFALEVAHQSDGAFDPAIGLEMEKRGFDRHYQTGEQILPESAHTRNQHGSCEENLARPSYRDIELDTAGRTLTLHRPMQLDLGAVAKGLAVDLAARELSTFENFAIDAGGDLYLSGRNRNGKPWSVGIRHPRNDSDLTGTVSVTNSAVCTSGDYERTLGVEADDTERLRADRKTQSQAPKRQHHILDPHSNTSASDVASVTVVADSAMVADALATAAFVLGPEQGLMLLSANDVSGCIMTPTAEMVYTAGWHALSSPCTTTQGL